jgi:hypothetical protein
VLEFGDITFGNADIFLRSDFNVGPGRGDSRRLRLHLRVELAGGVINLISKTGESEGGSIQGTVGLDYEEYRLDFDYGAKLSDTLRFHVGGFYRQGEGPRRAGYDGNKGGQIKLNVTKEFDGGYIRFHGKYLDDQAIGYLPNPVRVTGSNSDPKYSNVSGFSINQDTLHSRYLTRNVTLDGTTTWSRATFRRGQNPVVKAFGFETEFEVADGWTVTERFRYSDISGGFTSNFPAPSRCRGDRPDPGRAGCDRDLLQRAAGGASRHQPLLAQIVVFDVKLNSLDNITNDIRISREFVTGTGTSPRPPASTSRARPSTPTGSGPRRCSRCAAAAMRRSSMCATAPGGW